MQVHRSSLAALALAAAVAATAATPSSAQDGADQEIERCRVLPTDAERFACMERLVRGLSDAPEAAPAPIPPAVAAEPSPGEAGAAARDERGRSLFRLPFTRRHEPQEGPRVASSDAEADSFGAERIAARDGGQGTPERMTAHVVGFEEAHHQRLRVELDNGQIWEQQDAVPPWTEARYGAPESVEIWRSRFGGYRMQIVGGNLVLGVDRIR